MELSVPRYLLSALSFLVLLLLGIFWRVSLCQSHKTSKVLLAVVQQERPFVECCQDIMPLQVQIVHRHC